MGAYRPRVTPSFSPRKQYIQDSRGTYATASSAEEWRHTVEDGSHLDLLAKKWRVIRPSKYQGKDPHGAETQKKSLEETILELRNSLPSALQEHASPRDAILSGEYHQETKRAFEEKPWKRNAEQLRFISLWLFKTSIGKDLPYLVRQEVSTVIRMARAYIPANNLLAVEVDRHHHIRASKPSVVNLVFEGTVKQTSKATGDSRILSVGESFGELLCLGDEFLEDTIGVLSGSRGAELVQVPTEDYERLIKPYRRRFLLDNVAALRRCALFEGIPDTRLGRMALGLIPRTFVHKEIAIKQGDICTCVYVVSKGSFVCGRAVSKTQKNSWPVGRSSAMPSRVRVTRSSPCVTTARHGRGGFFCEEGLTLVTKAEKKGYVPKSDVRTAIEVDRGARCATTNTELNAGADVAQRAQEQTEIRAAAFCSIVSEGHSEVLPLVDNDLRLLLPEDRATIISRLKQSIQERPPDDLLRQREQVRHLMQNLKHSILRREEKKPAPMRFNLHVDFPSL